MKVLWFTNTPCGATVKLSPKQVSGSWLISLENCFRKSKEIELHIAFYYKKKIPNFDIDGVYYHPIYDKKFKSKFSTLINNYKEYLGFNNNHNMVELKNLVEEIKPDLIHYHGTESDFGLLQKEIDNIPSVISIQGILNSCFEKLFSGISRNIISKYENFFSKITLKTASMSEKRFKYGAERESEILKLSKNVIGRTEFDRHATLAIAPNIKYYIGNEILRDEFYATSWNKNSFNKKITITTIISSGYYKGLEVILRTALNLKNLNFNFKWIVIGQTEFSRDSKIVSKWLKQKFSDNNIEMIGYKKANEIVNILIDSDIYCQTSHIENSPNSVCEAMLLGMPIIASFAGGTSSILEHKKEGYLIQDGDSFSLAGLIIDISKNFQMAKKWGIEARKKAIVRHNHQYILNEYINIYREIINSSI